MADPGKTMRDKVRAATDEYDAAVASTTTTTTTPPATTNPSGQAPPGDIAGFTRIFVDDFNINIPLGGFPAQTGGKWQAYSYPWGDTYTKNVDSTRKGYYDPARVLSVHDSMLDYWIHTVDGQHLLSAPVPVLPGKASGNGWAQGQLYGRYAIRWKSDNLWGYKNAWLLWPDSGVWPRDGEIDYPELNLDGNSTISAFMHRQGATAGNDQDWRGSAAKPGEWHTSVIEWKPNYCAFYVDGQMMGTPITDRVPNTPMHVVLQTETNLDGSQKLTSTDSQSKHVYIDWFVAYKLGA